MRTPRRSCKRRPRLHRTRPHRPRRADAGRRLRHESHASRHSGALCRVRTSILCALSPRHRGVFEPGGRAGEPAQGVRDRGTSGVYGFRLVARFACDGSSRKPPRTSRSPRESSTRASRGVDGPGDLEALFTARKMVEVEHEGVRFAAIVTRMITQVRDHPREVLMPVPRLHRVEAFFRAGHPRAYE